MGRTERLKSYRSHYAMSLAWRMLLLWLGVMAVFVLAELVN
jgi:hypothetical protein